jgi:hypothetical protein
MKANTQMLRAVVLGLAVSGGLFHGASAWAVGYEDSDQDDDDMLQPEELNSPDVMPNIANNSAVFLGTGLSFGQTRSTEGDSSPGSTFLLHLEPGYQVSTGSWNRIELSADFLYGQLNFRMNSDKLKGSLNVPIEFGMLAKLGYGYSLGSDIMAMARVGVGPVVGKVKGDVEGTSVQTGTSTGIGAYLGWGMAMPIGGSWDATGGLSLTHVELDVGRLRGDGVSFNYGRTVVLNIPALDLGIRYRF